MADPSQGRPSSPINNPGDSYNADEENTGDSAPPLPLTLRPPAANLPMAQTPTVQSGNLGGRLMKKKKSKMAAVEEPGKKKMSASLENLPGSARTCGICRREFATARALFGHMRCHPDRRWRGAHPPPVSPRREVEVEPERLDMEQSRQAEDIANSLLNIGQTILRTEKFKATEGDQTGGTSSTAILVTGQDSRVEMGWMKRKERTAEETGVEHHCRSSSSSGDIPHKVIKKKKTPKTLSDDNRRKKIHYQLDLNKEAPGADDMEDDNDNKEETSEATSK